MALHRKQRGPVDALPQYVRLPAALAAPSPVASAATRHPRKPRARLLRDVYPAPRQQISSLQLRACFLLCVLLYFGTIYFADNIVSLGQALGSEPARSSNDFFVQSGVPAKDDTTVHLRVAVVDKDDDTGGGEENTPVKEEEGAAKRETTVQISPGEHPRDEKRPREDRGNAAQPASIQEQGATLDAKKADEPEATAPTEGLIRAKAAEREHKAPMRPQTVVRDAADTATGIERILPTPEQRKDAHGAVARANAPEHLAKSEDENNATEPHEHEVATAAATMKTEVRDGDAVDVLRHGAPPDEADEENKPIPEEQEDQADPAPHEEHR